MKKTQRFCLRQTEDSEWFAVPVELAERLHDLNEEGDWDTLYEEFGQYQVSLYGEGSLTFSDPQ